MLPRSNSPLGLSLGYSAVNFLVPQILAHEDARKIATVCRERWGYWKVMFLKPNSITISWSQTGPRLVADLQRAGIWPITISELARASRSATGVRPASDLSATRIRNEICPLPDNVWMCIGLILSFTRAHYARSMVQLIMAALCNRGAIIFLPCSFFLLSFFFLSSSFFSRLISAAVDWMSAILLHMAWP